MFIKLVRDDEQGHWSSVTSGDWQEAEPYTAKHGRKLNPKPQTMAPEA
jgi:hypothetical protein